MSLRLVNFIKMIIMYTKKNKPIEINAKYTDNITFTIFSLLNIVYKYV